MASVEHDLSDEQWTALREAWGGCVLRSSWQAIAAGLVLALLRGGRYTLDNIVPVCGSCNTSKCMTKSPAGCGGSA